FYIVTNDNALNFKVMRAPVHSPGKENWTEFIAHDPAVKIDGVDAFENFLAVSERRDGLRTIRICDSESGREHNLEYSEPVYVARVGENREYRTDTLRFTYESLVTPQSVFDYNVKTRTRELKKQDIVLGGFDASHYAAERVVATARDGTKISVSMVYKRGFVRDGNAPMLLYGYGSYGASSEPGFSSRRLSLLERGVTYALAHVRGGGEMGRPWYEDGKFLNKKNTFTDFIDCAEYLIAEKYTSSNRLAIMGGSAGGLLMGAVINMRPDLFKAVVAQVPFVDVMNTMLDPTIPLTVIEYEEWGNPNDKVYYEYMLSYSPYDNVTAQAYPNILITAGLNDPRVQYWEPAKWCAKLRAFKTDDNRLLLRTNMGAGHGGASGRYDRLKELAFEYAFVLDVLDMAR
ncbi:MAG: S9 family peptidase, partial [Planctomycetes bacterium]|nr:S9 family peptidase [Planctomycetota bacterium]